MSSVCQRASVKHKTKEMLAALKKAEQMLNSCWNEMMTQVEERLNKTGFGTFRFLTSEPTVGYLPVENLLVCKPLLYCNVCAPGYCGKKRQTAIKKALANRSRFGGV